MADKLKVAIVGVGGIAGAHLPGWRAAEDALQVLQIIDGIYRSQERGVLLD